LNSVAYVFPRSQSEDAVVTKMRFNAPAQRVWESLVFYEEVKKRPGWLLRLFLPEPLSTQGGKTQPGSLIRCRYAKGSLMKRITEVEIGHRIDFQVIEQNLGLEGCVAMTSGSYRLQSVAGGCEVALTTRYRGHLRPRWLWQRLERFLAHRLHRHILNGVRAELAS